MTKNPDERFLPVKTSRTFNRILDALGLRSKKVLDLGCGFGEHLVLFGKESLGVTTTTEEITYGKEHGIRIVQGNVELIDELHLSETFEALWANNLFEHLLSPHGFLIKLRTISASETLLVLGVPTIPRIPLLMKIRKFRGALAVAHINFFTRESLRLTVERSGWIVKDIRPFIFSNLLLDRLASFIAPHLYVVAEFNPNFKYADKKLNEWQDDALYAPMLTITGQHK